MKLPSDNGAMALMPWAIMTSPPKVLSHRLSPCAFASISKRYISVLLSPEKGLKLPPTRKLVPPAGTIAHALSLLGPPYVLDHGELPLASVAIRKASSPPTPAEEPDAATMKLPSLPSGAAHTSPS